jgi:three-Cys-motif partner protein
MNGKESFFTEKRPWSEIKDAVLKAYLEPYLAKVSRIGAPVRIADTFAGKGRFDDGKPGSPIIISEAIQNQLTRIGNRNTDIKGVFIEKKYSGDLAEALTDHQSYIYILSGEYEDRMEYFLHTYSARNTHFLFYVDPYGIKSLRFSHFGRLKNMHPRSIEVLLNMNAFGFMREGCRLLGYKEKKDEEIPEYYNPDVNNPDKMDEIAGGDYWRDIIKDFYATEMSMKDAEECFAHQYREKLNTVFKYVIDIPIKKHLYHIPKYRIIYGTDHEDGLLLMADNMCKQWDKFRKDERNGESFLFELDFPDPTAADYTANLESEIMIHLSSKEKSLKNLFVELMASKGIAFSTKHYKQILKDLGESGSINIRREPPHTGTGRRRTGWDHMATDYTIYLSKDKAWQ